MVGETRCARSEIDAWHERRGNPRPARTHAALTIALLLLTTLASAQHNEYTLDPTTTDQYQKEHHSMSDYLVYIGSYASSDEDGIHVYRLDMATGALTPTTGWQTTQR